jgi:hypothetical protein
MKVFAEYPPYNDPLRTTVDPNEFAAAEEHFNQHQRTLGTISKSEWEAITLYNVFAFQKFRPISGEETEQPLREEEDRRSYSSDDERQKMMRRGYEQTSR